MKQINVRIPDDLHARVRTRAEAERRSLQATILIALERYLEDAAKPGGSS